MKQILVVVMLLVVVSLVAEESFIDGRITYSLVDVNFPKSDEEISIYFHGDTTAVKTKDNYYAVVGVLYMLELYEEYEQECESVYEQHYYTDPITGERFMYAETCGVNPTFNGYIEFIKNKLGVD